MPTGADLLSLVESGRFPGQGGAVAPPRGPMPALSSAAPAAEPTGADLLALVETGRFPGQAAAPPPARRMVGQTPLPPHLRQEMFTIPAGLPAPTSPAGVPATIAARTPGMADPRFSDADFGNVEQQQALVLRAKEMDAELAARSGPDWAAIDELEDNDLQMVNRVRAAMGQEALSSVPQPRMKERLAVLNAERVKRGLQPVATVPGQRTVGQVLSDEWKAENIPFVGGAIEAAKNVGNQDIGAQLADMQRGTLDEWKAMLDAQEKQLAAMRGTTIPGKVAEITAQSAPFMAEFIAAPGVGPAKAGAGLLNKGSRMLLNTALQAATTSLARTGGAVSREAADTYDVQPLADGQLQLVMAKEGRPIGDAVANAGVDTMVELFSERTGKVFAVIGAPVAKGVRRAAGLKPIRAGVESFLERMGYHGVLEEMGEERVGELLREAATRMGAADLPQEIPSGEQLAVEAAAFAIPALAGRTASGVLNALEKRKNRAGMYSIPDAETGKEVSDVIEKEVQGSEQGQAKDDEAKAGQGEIGVHPGERAADDHHQEKSPAVHGDAGGLTTAKTAPTPDLTAIKAKQDEIREIRTAMRDLQRKLEKTTKKEDRERLLDELDTLSTRAKTLREEAAGIAPAIPPTSLSPTASPVSGKPGPTADVEAPPPPQPAAPPLGNQGIPDGPPAILDSLVQQVVSLAERGDKLTPATLQRRFKIGYGEATKLLAQAQEKRPDLFPVDDPTKKLQGQVAAGRPVRGEPLTDDEVLAQREPERESIVKRNLGIGDKGGYARDAEDPQLIVAQVALPSAIADELEWIPKGWFLTSDPVQAQRIGKSREGKRGATIELTNKSVTIDPFGLDHVADNETTLFKTAVKLVKGDDGVFRAQRRTETQKPPQIIPNPITEAPAPTEPATPNVADATPDVAQPEGEPADDMALFQGEDAVKFSAYQAARASTRGLHWAGGQTDVDTATTIAIEASKLTNLDDFLVYRSGNTGKFFVANGPMHGAEFELVGTYRDGEPAPDGGPRTVQSNVVDKKPPAQLPAHVDATGASQPSEPETLKNKDAGDEAGSVPQESLDHIADPDKMVLTDDPIADLRRYENQQGYTEKTHADILNADVQLQELKRRAADQRRSENAEGSAEARAARQREREQGYGDAAVMRWSREALVYAPLEDLPTDVREAIQHMAAAKLEHKGIRDNKVITSEATRAALGDIAAGRSTGGAEYDNQRRRMIELLLGEFDDRTIGEKDLGVPERQPDERIVKALEQAAGLPPGDPIMVPQKPKNRPQKQGLLSPEPAAGGTIETEQSDEQTDVQPDGTAPAELLGGKSAGESGDTENGGGVRSDDGKPLPDGGKPSAGVGSEGGRPVDAGGDVDGGSRPVSTDAGGADAGKRPVRGGGSSVGKPDGGRSDGQPGVSEPAGPGDSVPGSDTAPAESHDVETQGAASPPHSATDLFTITPDVETFPAGAVTRARANLDALKLAKQILAENRPATDAEKLELVKYSSFASARELFDDYKNPTWQRLRDEVTTLIGHRAFYDLKDSASNAMFTSPEIVRWMYDAARRMGVHPLHTLEPSMGVGHFFGAMPGDIRRTCTLTGVELDQNSAMIAKLLYPSADIRQEGFEAASLPENFFDLVVGNVPFGGYGIADKRYNTVITHRIHNYFIVRALDLARPGGMVAVITSAYTLNGADAEVRREMHKRGDLVAAVRLNKESLPGTKVTADILFFRKRHDGEKRGGEAFIEAEKIPFKDKNGAEQTAYVSEYFIKHPEMVVGEHVYGSMYGFGDGVQVEPREGKTLDVVFSKLPGKIFKNAGDEFQEIINKLRKKPPVAAEEMLPHGTLQVDNGRIHRVEVDVNGKRSAVDVEDDIAPGQKDRDSILLDLRKLLAIRDAALRVIRMQSVAGEAPENIIAAQKALEKLYDGFVWANRSKGPRWMSGSHVTKRLREDQYTREILRSLEDWDDNAKKATKGRIFTGRVVAPASRRESAASLGDAVAISLDETNALDLVRMAELLGSTTDAVRKQLLDDELAFEEPSGAFVAREEYLAGDSRAKLKQAEAAAALDKKFKRNVDALRSIVPIEWGPGLIQPQLGQAWIPLDVYEQFLTHLLAGGSHVVRYVKETNTWVIAISASQKFGVEATSTWGTKKAPAHELLQDAFEQKLPVVKMTVQRFNPETGRDEPVQVLDPVETASATEKQKEIKAEFARWLFADAKRINRLVPLYNDLFNTLVPRVYSGKHMTFPGMNPEWVKRFYKHQRSGVHRIVASTGNVLLHHPMGAGKTMTYVAGAMELKRLGYVRGTAMVVHNKTIEGFAKQAAELYPTAKIVVLSSKEKTRIGQLARLAAGEVDIVLMTHATAKAIPMRNETIEAYFDERIRELEEVKKFTNDRVTIRELSEAIKKLKVQLKNKLAELNKKQKSGLRWEDVFHGHAFFYDESQALKNLSYVTGMKGIAGLGSAAGNLITFDAHMKVTYHNQTMNGRGVVMGTGTPVANSLVELFSIMKYLIPAKLKAMGLDHLDAWVAQFGEISAETERTVQATYKDVTRFRRFSNAGNLLRMYRDFADVITEEELDANMSKPRPIVAKNSKGVRDWEDVLSPPDPGIDRIMELLAQFAKWISTHYKEAKLLGYNYLVITNIARAAGVDMRLIHPTKFKENPEGKLTKAADNITRVWKEEAAKKGVQLVFSEQGVNTSDRISKGKFSSYLDLVEKLVARGIPREQIAIVQDYGDKVEPLFEKVRNGDVRVLIGNLAGLGVGVNVQNRVAALHLIDPPWRPDQVAQGVARAIRAGNSYSEVKLFRYAQINSGDEMLYNKLFVKLAGIKVVGSNDFDLRTVDDVEAKEFSLAEIQALASKNPFVLQFHKATQDVTRLTQLRIAHANQQAANIQRAEANRVFVRNLRDRKNFAAPTMKVLAENPDALPATINDRSMTKHKNLGEAVIAEISALAVPAKDRQIVKNIGKVRGLNLFITRRPKDTLSNEVSVRLVREDKLTDENALLMSFGNDHDWFVNADPTGVATRIINLASGYESDVRGIDERMKKLEAQAVQFDQALGKFDKEAELRDAERSLAALDAQVKAFEAQMLADQQAADLLGSDHTDGLGGLEEFMDLINEIRSLSAKQQAQADAQESGTDATDDSDDDDPDMEGFHETPENRAERIRHGMSLEEVRANYKASRRAERERREREEAERAAGGSDLPLGPSAAVPHGMFPRDMTPEQTQFLGELRRSGRVSFGMGAMLNVEDTRGPIRRWLDRLRERILDLSLSEKDTTKGKAISAAAYKVGQGIFGNSYGLDPATRWAFERYPGGRRVAKHEGKKILQRINSQLKELGPMLDAEEGNPILTKLNAVLNGDMEAKELSPALQEVVANYRALVNDATRTLLEEVPDKVAKNLAGLRNWRERVIKRMDRGGIYARRYYRSKEVESEAATVAGLPVAKRNVGPRLRSGMFAPRRSDEGTPDAVWTLSHPDGTFTQFDDLDEASDAWQAEIELHRKQYGQEVYKKVKLQDPFGSDVRLKLEEITDPRERMVRTIYDLYSNVESAKLFNFLDAAGEAYADTEDRPTGIKMQRVPEHPTFGAIAGKWVPQPVFDNIMAFEVVRTGAVAQVYDLYMFAWKSFKVKFNLPTIVRNWGSTVLNALLGGPAYLVKAKQALDEIRSEGPAWQYLLAHNRVTAGWAREDLDSLRDRLKDPNRRLTRAMMEWFEETAEKRVARKARTWVHEKLLPTWEKIDDAASTLYDIVDQVHIVAKFLHETETNQLSREEALDELGHMPNYSDIGHYGKWLRQSPLIGMTFAAFNNTSAQIILRYMRRNPGRVLALAFVPEAMTIMTKVLLGLDDDEIEAIYHDNQHEDGIGFGTIRRLLPPFLRQFVPTSMVDYFRPLFPMRDSTGKVTRLDLRYVYPLADQFRTLVMGGLRIPWLFQTPLADTVIETISNRSQFTGQQIADPDAHPIFQLGSHIGNIFAHLVPAPSMLVRGAPKVAAAMWEGMESGKLFRLLLKEVVGVNIMSPTITRADAYKLAKQKFGEDGVDAMLRFVELFETYRKESAKPIDPRDVVQSVLSQQREEALR